MFDNTALQASYQLGLLSIQKLLIEHSLPTLQWEARLSLSDQNLSEYVSTLLSEEQAKALLNRLKDVFPYEISQVRSRSADAPLCFRVMVPVQSGLQYHSESAYLNAYLNTFRRFPPVFWFDAGDGVLTARYAQSMKVYFSLIRRVLQQCDKGGNATYFFIDKRNDGTLHLSISANNFRKLVDGHKLQCLHLLEQWLGENIQDVTAIKRCHIESSHSFYTNLIEDNRNEGGLPALRFRLRNTDDRKTLQSTLPPGLSISFLSPENVDGDPNAGREIELAVESVQGMFALLQSSIAEKKRAARVQFCRQILTLEKGEVFSSVSSMKPRIYQFFCPKDAYLTLTEISKLNNTVQTVVNGN
jgi:hypothetical protein